MILGRSLAVQSRTISGIELAEHMGITWVGEPIDCWAVQLVLETLTTSQGQAVQPKILIVDDERLARWCTSVFLRQHGFDVMEASDGKEALALLNEHTVDLVISDIRMPHLNGLLLRDIINTKFSHTAVLLMTAYHPALEDKSDPDCLLKPIVLDELLSKARQILKRKEDQ